MTAHYPIPDAAMDAIRSRGFDKLRTRKFNGQVERR